MGTNHANTAQDFSFMPISSAFPRPSSLAWLIASLALPAQAAEPAEPDELDTVVVRSRQNNKRVAVQSTPSAITSLSGAKLEEQGIGSIRELGNIVPNLYQPRTAVSYLNSSFFIRGIGELDAQGEPSVAVYIDDLYWPKNLGANQELLDIAQVDIFRGPQGHSFGHSAIAGALRITSVDPSTTAHVRALAEIGNYQDRKVALAVNGPLSDVVSGSFAATVHQRDGLTHNDSNGQDSNDIDYQAARGKLRFQFSRDLDATVTLAGVQDGSTARGVQNLSHGDRDAHNQIHPEQSYDSQLLSLTVNYTLDSHWRAKLLTGGTRFEQTAFFDNTGDYYARGSQLVTYRDETFQNELQLLGHYDQVDVVTGIYLYHESWYTNRRANTAANATNTPAAIRYRPVYSLIDQGTDNRAVYGEVKYKATPALTLTGGLRYNWEEHTQSNQLFNLVAASPFQSNAGNFLQVLEGQPQAQVWSANGDKTWTSWSPKASIDYQWRQGLMQYLTYSEGTKSAGYDYRAQTPTAAGQRQAALPYDPETARNLETGLKADWLGGELRTNLALFYTRFDDIQLTTTDPTQTPAISRRFNAGQGSTRGLEFEGTWLPSNHLQFDLNGAFLKARLDRFDGAPATLTAIPASSVNPNGLVLRSAPFAGAELPNAPHFQARAAVTWKLPLASADAWVINSSVSHQTHSYSDATNNPTTRQPSQTYLNGSVSYLPGGSPWSVVLAVQNLANKHYALGEGFTQATNPVDGSSIYRTTNYNDPRTVTLALKYDLDIGGR